MGIFDFIKGQFIDVIRWENPENYLIVKKFDRSLDEIKDTTNLIVDPGYAAIFIHNGKIEAIQTEGGKWVLNTENTPFITAIKSWKRLGESNDKAGVYFIKTLEILNQKWGTKNPVKYVDNEYKFPIKLRAFGNFTFKISDIEKFFVNYIGTRSEVSVDEIRNIIVDRLIGEITSILANESYSYIDIDKKRSEIADKIEGSVNAELEILGLTITDFRIEDTNFDEETEKLIMKVSSQTANSRAINELKDINSNAMNNYTKTRNLDIMEEAAGNEGNAGAMMGTVVGMNLGNNLNSIQNGISNNTDENEQKLEKLKSLYDKKLISEEEYNTKKREILENL